MLFGVLGPLRIADGDHLIAVNLAPKPRLLLAVLLAHAGRPVAVDALVDALWPQNPPASARRNLQLYVHQLRTEFGPHLVATGPSGYAFTHEETDAQQFTALVRDGVEQRRDDLLQQALDLWRGPAYAEFLECPPVAEEAARLEQQRLAASEAWAEVAVAAGRPAVVVDDLRALVRQHPFRETLTIHLMTALYAAGRPAEALEAYRQAQENLREELGTDPGPALQKVHREILRGEMAVAPQPGSPVPRQLPQSALHFVGRDLEMGVLVAEVQEHARARQTVVISAIDGMAGIGKTALAVHAAHTLAAAYPDGQLFLDLHAHTRGRDPMEPDAALDTLLRSLGVDAERIPPAVDERSALWRTETAKRRLLVVLDNAADAAQVAPLLPGSPGCLVLVTSRRQLTELHTAQSLTLSVLPQDAAVALFAKIVGERARIEPDAVAEVVDLCGRLPLAIRIVAERMRQRPLWTVEYTATRLRGGTARLSGVAAAFALSYDSLTPAQRRLFRLLGLHAGIDIDVYAAAAIADLPVDEAEDLLESLLDVHLLQQRHLGRYTFHDLLREHARDCAEREESEAERILALHRMVDYYLAAARNAADTFYPGRLHIDLELTRPPAELPPLADAPAAARWFMAERRTLLAVLDQAISLGLDRHGWLIPREMAGYLMSQERLDDNIAALSIALAAARRLGDVKAQQLCLLNLSSAYGQRGRLDQAIAMTHSAREVSAELGDRRIEGLCHRQLSNLYSRSGRFDEAGPHFTAALEIIAELGPRVELGYAATDLAWMHVMQGAYADALVQAELGLQIARECDNPGDEAMAFVLMAMALSRLGRYAEALDHVDRGMAIARHADRPSVVVDSLIARGDTHRRQGRHDAALADLAEAREILGDGYHPEPDCELHLVLGNLHADRGEYAEAQAAYERSLDRARRLGYRHEEAEALGGLGRLPSRV